MESHAEFLRHVSLDDALVDALKLDFRTAPIDDADRAMCEYVEQLSRDATQLEPQNLDVLRGHGFDDKAILQITLIASWFNYVNRVADALGVGRGPATP